MSQSTQDDTPNMNLEGTASADLEIVKRVQAGDIEAYNILVLRYQHKAVKVAYDYVHNYVDANDVAQEAFIRAYRAIGSFRGESAFYTWLFRIVANAAKSFLEQNQKHRYSMDVDDPEFDHEHDINGALTNIESPDTLIESEELQNVISKAFSELPEDLRRAITLREINNKSYEEIATMTGAPIGTVRSRIFRARQMIEEKIVQFSKGL